jgi:hypothetical protein
MQTLAARSLTARLALAGVIGLAAGSAWGQATEGGTGGTGGTGSSPGTSGPSAPGTPGPVEPGTSSPAQPAEGLPAPDSPAVILGSATPYGFNSTNPWYVGVGQGLTYDSNATRTPTAKSDTFSSTSLFGGFNQAQGRARFFGTGHLTYNKYFDFDQLSGPQYNFAGGLDWDTLYNLSGNLRVAFGHNNTSTISGVIAPFTGKNPANTRDINGTARWGGSSSLSVDGNLGYSDTEYEDPRSTSLDTSYGTASLALRYHGHGLWDTGIGLRYTQQRTPRAALVGNTFVANNVDGRYVDFYFGYNPGAFLQLAGRLSYTKTTNSGISSADFSGWTGNVSANWIITGKSSVNAYAARNVGYNTAPFSSFTLIFIGNTPVLTPINGLYQNNQLTSNAGIKYVYLATGKITAKAGLNYSRAHLITTTLIGQGATGETVDVSKLAYLGADWSITRNWSLNATLSYERRELSGLQNTHYDDTLIGAMVQYTWP